MTEFSEEYPFFKKGARVRTRQGVFDPPMSGVVSRRDGSYVYVYVDQVDETFEFYDCELEFA